MNNGRFRIHIPNFILKAYQAINRKTVKFTNVSEDKIGDIKTKIIRGALPRSNYFLFLILSVLIASIGLINNSAAVIIGAMLISPLMTPIFGASMGTVIGRSTLLRDSLASLFFGAFLAIGASFILGIMPFTPLILTEEILARTSPNLFDMFIAALAGTAGCIALVDDSLGESLPGVAIATSLTPPLGVSGLCLAMGNFEYAYGAFLLFFTNFLVILLVSGLIFHFSGFGPKGNRREQWLRPQKPFWVTLAGIILVC